MADEQSINIPQLVIVLVLGGLAIKYLFFTTPAANTARPRGATIRAREQDVEQIQSMFPQVGRRLIMWDLQRNGGNIAVTTERILSGRGLEEVREARPKDPSALETTKLTCCSHLSHFNHLCQPKLWRHLQA